MYRTYITVHIFSDYQQFDWYEICRDSLIQYEEANERPSNLNSIRKESK